MMTCGALGMIRLYATFWWVLPANTHCRSTALLDAAASQNTVHLYQNPNKQSTLYEQAQLLQVLPAKPHCCSTAF